MLHQTIQNVPVPALGFGTWQLTGQACLEGVEHALRLGYRHLDTAQAYDNEDQVGQAMRNAGVPRGEIFLTTKVWYDRFTADRLPPSVDESLRKLRTDYVDLLLLHWPNPDVLIEETLDALKQVQAAGKARHIGLSNYPPALLKQAAEHINVFCNQVEYHPYLSQDTLLAEARQRDFLLTAYSPIARGRVHDDPVLLEIANGYGKTPAQVTLRWLIQQDHVCAIPKAASAEHRESNLAIFDFALTDEQMRKISALDRGQRLANPPWAPNWER